MAKDGTDLMFSGSIPLLYETHWVPLIFVPYAFDAVACQFGAMFFPDRPEA